MAHGIGNYWEPLYNNSFTTNEYFVYFRRLHRYYYEDMSDSYEPDSEWLDEYEVVVYGTYVNRNRQVCRSSRGIRTGSISREEANKIWYNIKHNNVTYESIKNYFIKLAGRELSD